MGAPDIMGERHSGQDVRPLLQVPHLQNNLFSSEALSCFTEISIVLLEFIFGISINVVRLKYASSVNRVHNPEEDPLLSYDSDIEEGYQRDLGAPGSCWSTLTFDSIKPVLEKGAIKQLGFEDLLPLPSEMNPLSCHDGLLTSWQALWANGLSNPSLFKVSTFADMEGEETFDATLLGHVDEVVEERVADDDVIMIKGTKCTSAVSVILRGANEYMLDEMDRSLHDAICIVKRSMESNMVVAGGGAVEAALSVYLEYLAMTLGSREQLAIAEFAESLLIIPKVLAVNAAKDATELVAKLRAYHHQTRVMVGALLAEEPKLRILLECPSLNME